MTFSHHELSSLVSLHSRSIKNRLFSFKLQTAKSSRRDDVNRSSMSWAFQTSPSFRSSAMLKAPRIRREWMMLSATRIGQEGHSLLRLLLLLIWALTRINWIVSLSTTTRLKSRGNVSNCGDCPASWRLLDLSETQRDNCWERSLPPMSFELRHETSFCVEIN